MGVVLAACGPGLAVAQVATEQVDGGEDGSTGYPVVFVERPLTLPARMAQVSISGARWWIEEEDDVSITSVGAVVGLTDRWQVSSSTRWRLAPEREWREIVGVGSRVLAVDTARFDLAPGLSVPILFDGDRDTGAVPAVTLDAIARIRAVRRIALYLGDDLATVGFTGDGSASIDLNATLVTQLNDHLALRISAEVLHIRLHGDGRESGGPYWLAWMAVASPASWIDLWLGIQLQSESDAAIGGVTGRL
ncbi:MAG TPA: hypothetical protein VFU21_13130 [Kofleriaceae bacterium]|nr:hypothetical protein [Kofleriaceae bacterium]